MSPPGTKLPSGGHRRRLAKALEAPWTPSAATSNHFLAQSILARAGDVSLLCQTGLIGAKSGTEIFMVRSQGHS
jgi:hypothetical protein